MKKITHPIYEDYEIQPYISESRDLEDWIAHPRNYPYSVIEKKKMIPLDEGILPGDLIMLWRIHFGNFTNETVIPAYFEYRYGVDSDESIKLLLNLGYIKILSLSESLEMFNLIQLKEFLKTKHLSIKGKKQDLVHLVSSSFSEEELKGLSSTRLYQITSSGSLVLTRHQDVIQQHGIKG